MLYVRRSIGRKLMLAVGLPSFVFSVAGVLWLRRETSALAPGLDPVYRGALVALGVFTAAMGLTFVLVIRVLVRNPLKRLVAAMKRAQAGDFLHRVPVESDDEIGRLARTYNETLAALTDLNARRVEDAIALDALQRELAVKADLHQKMVRLSQADTLTGAHNRRSLFARLDQELERSRRFQHALAVALVDVDRFREYNEALGHGAGDVVLKTVAGLLGGAVRKVDLVARYGGEEFAVVLAGADRAAAAQSAENLRAAVEAAALPHPAAEAGRVTISVGTAVFPDDGRDLGGLVDAADSALYAAKRAGRNAVRAHEPGMRSHPGRRRDEKLTADADA